MIYYAALLAVIMQLNRQESEGTAGHCEGDEQAGITQLSWQLSKADQTGKRSSVGPDQVTEHALIT